MVIKSIQTFRQWNKKTLVEVHLPVWLLGAYVGVSVAAEIIYLIIWTAVEIPDKNTLSAANNRLRISCHSTVSYLWIALYLFSNGIQLLIAGIITFITRNVNTYWRESKFIFYTVWSIILFALIASPIVIALLDYAYVSYVIGVLFIWISATTILGFLFLSKLIFILFFKTEYGRGSVDPNFQPDRDLSNIKIPDS